MRVYLIALCCVVGSLCLGEMEVEEYIRVIDGYGTFSRVIDTLRVKGKKQGAGCLGTQVSVSGVQKMYYYDEFGSIDKDRKYNRETRLIGYRYPVQNNEKISFTVERVGSVWQEKMPLFFWESAGCLREERSSFPFFWKDVREAHGVSCEKFFSDQRIGEKKRIWNFSSVFVQCVIGILTVYMIGAKKK
ncbi:hypothetical protein NEFER02_0959 [Nematocida sp. LUAm2]|nr:hypothetical protein NEFER02_0959 [Nematocida sp. LUAm2]